MHSALLDNGIPETQVAFDRNAKRESNWKRKLAQEIAQLESARKKLPCRDERGRAVPLDPVVSIVFQQEAEKQKKSTSA
jgi:hypothetical protein